MHHNKRHLTHLCQCHTITIHYAIIHQANDKNLTPRIIPVRINNPHRNFLFRILCNTFSHFCQKVKSPFMEICITLHNRVLRLLQIRHITGCYTYIYSFAKISRNFLGIQPMSKSSKEPC